VRCKIHLTEVTMMGTILGGGGGYNAV